MKKYISICFCGLLVLALSAPASAQIFEKIGKKIEKSIERRAERKIDQGIEKGLDKAEEGTEDAVEGALTKKEKPATEAKKALPDNYEIKINGSGPDLFLEYRMSFETESAQANQMDMAMKIYTAPSQGKGRSEVVMTIPIVGEMRMTTLSDLSHPEQIILLNERKQQYSKVDFSKMADAASDEEYQVRKLGTVKLHGLNCVQAEATNEEGQRFEIWTTKEIPGYEDMMAFYSKAQSMGSDNLWTALQEAGCAGFMVRLKVDVENGSSVMELVDIQKSSHDASMFKIPPGYEENNGNWVKRYIQQNR